MVWFRLRAVITFWLFYSDFYSVFKEKLSCSFLELFAVRKYWDYFKGPMGSFRYTFDFSLLPVDFLMRLVKLLPEWDAVQWVNGTNWLVCSPCDFPYKSRVCITTVLARISFAEFFLASHVNRTDDSRTARSALFSMNNKVLKFYTL